jgi:hypothetical protein
MSRNRRASALSGTMPKLTSFDTKITGPAELATACSGAWSAATALAPGQPNRKVIRSIHEGARDLARDLSKTDAYVTSRRERKKVEMLFAHLKRILKLDRLRLRGPNGAKDEFHLAATAQNLRKLAKLVPIHPKTVPA